ncbi:MAG: hypothetical protein HY799_05585 [Nitrosomonadales bacterium]|nr:hypothetical protein [Nitrosomonadales bacterium]
MLAMLEKSSAAPRHPFMALVLSMLFATGAHAASFAIAPELLSDLREQRVLLASKVRELDEVSKQIVVAQADKRSATSSIRRLEGESEQARTKLEKLQAFDRDNPGTISREQVVAAEDQNRQAFSALKTAKEKKSGADARINSLSVDSSAKYADFLRLQKSFARDVDRVVDTQLQERLLVLQVKKEVSVTERVACGDDSIPVCKERSKKAAELKASETGSIVFVNSLTEVKNFKLSKEELRSEVQATLSNKVFSNQHMVGETEYETTITANVEPVIGDTLREQMAAGIRSQIYDTVGGKIDFSQVQDPSQFSDEQGDEAPVKTAKTKKKQVVQEEEVEEQPAPREEAPRPAPAPVRRLEKPTFTF